MGSTIPSSGPRVWRVYLIDHRPIVRVGLQRILEEHGTFAVCGQSANLGMALADVCRLAPDALVVQIDLPGVNDSSVLRRLRRRLPEVVILALSPWDEPLYQTFAVQEGASAVLPFSSTPGALVDTLAALLGGRGATGTRSSTARDNAPASRKRVGRNGSVPHASLSQREVEVFEQFGLGLRTREVADRLFVSVKTVESHRANILRKLKLRSGAQLVRTAVLWRARHRPARLA